MPQRMVGHFSCGAASAVTAKLLIAEHGHDNVVLVNAFIKEEDLDNRRFLADCEKWLDHPITVLRDEKYGASVIEVFKRKRFIKGPHGAPCSTILKRDLLATFTLPGDIEALGYTFEEQDRLEELRGYFPHRNIIAPLVEKNLTKDDCFAMLARAGLVLPLMYRKGYENANCPLCPKAGIAYWQNIREDFPGNFVQIQTIQEELGPGSYFLRWRSGPRNGERMPLSELPPGRGDMKGEPTPPCSFFCQMAEEDIG